MPTTPPEGAVTARDPALPRVFRRPWLDPLLVVVSVADAASKGIDTTWGWPALLALLAVVAVPLRRRWPLLTLLVAVPAMYWPALQVAPAILLADHTYRRRTFPLVTITAVTLVLTVASSILTWYPGPGWQVVNLQSAIYFGGFVGGASLVGQLLKVRDEQRAQLLALQESRRREHLLVERAARADERAHLAHEMHDVVSHQVSLIAIQAGALRVTDGLPDPVHETAETIRTLAVRANDELRQVLGALRSEDVAASLDAQHTIGDIAELWRTSEVSGWRELPPADVLATVPAPVQRAVHRIAQEALTNVRKHADGAHVELTVTVEDHHRGSVTLHVVNDAPPRPAAGEGLRGGAGLTGVTERARSFGGTLTAVPTAAGGFAVTAWLPFHRR